MKETEEQKKQKEQKKQNEEKIKELKQQKKEMQDQLDELNGRTAKSKAVCVLVFLLVLAALMGTFTGMVKADVGGVASNLLAPVLADYVKNYSDMKPKDAASVFDGMMPDQMKLVVKILKNMSAEQRSAIISKMNVQNASDITVEMDKELP